MRCYRRWKKITGSLQPGEDKGLTIVTRLRLATRASDICSRPQTGGRDREGGRWAAIGVAICKPHVCACGAQVSSRGELGLSCSLGFGRQARHSNVHDIIHRSLNRAGIPAIKEPSGLTRSDGKMPDWQTLIPWNDGRTLLWDATVVDTVAASHITETAAAAGGAAEIAATRKHAKYSELERRYTVVPVAV